MASESTIAGSGAPHPHERGIGARLPSVPTLAKVGFALLCLGAIVGLIVYPTYPNYDSIYSLIWGKELIDGHNPSFEAYRAPTQHPLWVALGAVLSLFGSQADKLLMFITVGSFVAMVVAAYKLCAQVFTPLIGLIAGVLLVARLDFPFLAVRGYVDVPYLCLVMWAAVLIAREPRRGGPVWLLLIAAGLMRPEAWLFAGMYVLYLGWHASWPERIKYCAYAAIAPVIWCISDWAVTGDLLYSLHYTTRSAELLGRQRGIADLPYEISHSLISILRTGGLLLGIAGFVLAVKMVGKRTVIPSILLFSGLGTYVLLVIGGFTAIPRYLFISALALVLFAAFALGGFDVLSRESKRRRPWMYATIAVAAMAVVYTFATLHYGYVNRDLSIRGDAHHALEDILKEPQVAAARRCGPVTVPTYKLIPDTRWILDAPERDVIARTQTDELPRARKGVALIAINHYLLFNPAYGPYVKYASGTGAHDPPTVQVPPPGFRRIAYNRYFSAYARC